MTTVTVTMREPRRSEDGLSILVAGSTPTVSLEYGRYLVRNGFATSTDDLSGSRGTNPLLVSREDEQALRGMVAGSGVVSQSRSVSSISDNGATLELAAGVTYTLADTASLPAGVVLLGPVSGTATIAVSGAATINGATTSISVNAGQVYSIIQRKSNPAAFLAKGG